MDKLELLNKIISDHVKIPVENLSDDISNEEESQWDSVAHLKMISEIESTFKIKLEIEEVIELETVGKIRETVLNKLQDE